MEIINISSARWQAQLKNSVVNFSQLADYLKNNFATRYADKFDALKSSVKIADMAKVIEKYPMRITPYYLSLIKDVDDPIWKQAVPDKAELFDSGAGGGGWSASKPPDSSGECSEPSNVNVDDPLHEDRQSPVPSIIHRYPDRAIFLVSNQCAMYCRHCMRKRKVGLQTHGQKTSSLYNIDEIPESYAIDFIDQGLTYIRQNKQIHDVILSGGDPLLLSTERLDRILFAIRQIDHVETIRIHTRVICTLPFRITDNLASVLEKYHPLYINTHFNHPSEITDEAASASHMLARAGIPLGCQTVLLKGVNDTPEIMTDLMRRLIRIRVKPYYLHHPDAVAGTAHFRPSLETGLNIMKAMRGNLTGIAIPQYMLDLPEGYGKVPILPDYIKQRNADRAFVENYQGRICEYRF